MNALAFRALRLLADGRFRSGEAVARTLGRSRTTVNEALRGVDALGVELFRVPGKGYRLAEPIEFLEAARIVPALGPAASRVRLVILDAVDSTNTRLSSLAAQGAASGTCVVAEWQSAGRGRRGRAWQSGLGSGIAFSLLWIFEGGAGHLGGLSLSVSVAIARALASCGVEGVGLKWPNDLLIAHRKLAGVLVETSGEHAGPTAAVIGIGVNHHLPDLLAERVDQPATDVLGNAAVPPSRNAVFAALVRELVIELEHFEASGFAASRDAWRHLHAYAGQRVRVTPSHEPAYDAEVVDIADDGALLVAVGGRTVRVTSAEIGVSVSPVSRSTRTPLRVFDGA